MQPIRLKKLFDPRSGTVPNNELSLTPGIARNSAKLWTPVPKAAGKIGPSTFDSSIRAHTSTIFWTASSGSKSLYCASRKALIPPALDPTITVGRLPWRSSSGMRTDNAPAS